MSQPNLSHFLICFKGIWRLYNVVSGWFSFIHFYFNNIQSYLCILDIISSID